jgi:hypothetical protein
MLFCFPYTYWQTRTSIFTMAFREAFRRLPDTAIMAQRSRARSNMHPFEARAKMLRPFERIMHTLQARQRPAG